MVSGSYELNSGSFGNIAEQWKKSSKRRRNGNADTGELGLGHAALKGQKDQVSAAANAELIEQVGHVKFYGAFGNIELAGDFLVGEILKKRIENFLFAAAKIGDGFRLETPALAREDGIDETRKYRTGHPETALRNERKRAGQLIAGFGVSEDAFDAKAQQGVGVGFVDGVAHNDEARVSVTFQDVGEQSTGGLARGMRVNHEDLSAGRLKIAQVGGQGGFELLGNDLELRGFAKKTLKFAQDERMWGQQADS